MSQTRDRLNGNMASDETRDKPAKQGAGDRERRPGDRLALSETVYLSTAAIIQETRDAIDSSLDRLRMRSNLESGTALARPLVSPPASEASTRIQPETTEGTSKREVVRARTGEDPITQARRHVREAEGHVARQEALVERLSHNEKHAALAEQAREILGTLRRSLSLAREHLALELKK